MQDQEPDATLDRRSEYAEEAASVSHAEPSKILLDLMNCAVPARCQAAMREYATARGVYIGQLRTEEPSEPAAADQPSFCELLMKVCDHLHERDRRRTSSFASAAHELKTPLAIMTGYLQLTLSGKMGPLNRRQRQVLDDVQIQCARLEKVVEDLLAYSTVEAGKVSLRYVIGDLNACISEIVELWRPQFSQAGRVLELRKGSSLAILRFDPEKVQHVVSNLLDNALKYTPREGLIRVEIETKFWERRRFPSQRIPERRRQNIRDVANAVQASVSDTGMGISPEHHFDIFEPFFRLQEGVGVRRGIGLGLAIARRLIEAQGGKIWVESSHGAGARFCFLLPLLPSSGMAWNTLDR
jgi:signal transduction histidine kinase